MPDLKLFAFALLSASSAYTWDRELLIPVSEVDLAKM
jgi:hypothetical protein